MQEMLRKIKEKIEERKDKSITYSSNCQRLVELIENSGVGEFYPEKNTWLIRFPETDEKRGFYIEVIYFEKYIINSNVFYNIDRAFQEIEKLLEDI